MDSKFLIITLLVLTTIASTLVSCTTDVTQQNTYSTFVKTTCSSATYPSVCLKSLLPYALTVKKNPLTLVKVALTTSLRSTNATLTTVSQLSKTKKITKYEAAILKDCIYNLKDSMSQIKDSLKALSGISKSYDKNFVISNAQTWTSAAITNENTCLDGFSDRKVSPALYKKIRNSILSLARVSSNALYLINHLSV